LEKGQFSTVSHPGGYSEKDAPTLSWELKWNLKGKKQLIERKGQGGKSMDIGKRIPHKPRRLEKKGRNSFGRKRIEYL